MNTAEWAKLNEIRASLGKRGAGKYEVRFVNHVSFYTKVDRTGFGARYGKTPYKIANHTLTVFMPIDWMILPQRYTCLKYRQYYVNVAMPINATEGECMILYKSMGALYVWRKAYLFKHYLRPVKDWNEKTRTRIITQLVKAKLETHHA